ncbi:MAG: tRNA (adenine-N1)-methyltransferase [Acidimicrobiales bacterium]
MSAARLAYDDLVLLIDHKGRRYLATLTAGKEFQSHAGVLPHDDIVGHPEGAELSTTRGQRLRVFRPTLSDYVLSMPRGAQVIYPKDLAPILFMADIGPGVRVLESGVGSGALSMSMLRAGADIVGYELREDFAARAAKNVRAFLGPEVEDRYRVEIRDAYEGIDATDLDRIVLDLPEPWRVAPHAEGALRPGGLLVSYSPSITQVMQLTDALRAGPFTEVKTTEVLHRTWHVEGQAVRPDHRMVAHTGFLTSARRLGPTISRASSPAPPAEQS